MIEDGDAFFNTETPPDQNHPPILSDQETNSKQGLTRFSNSLSIFQNADFAIDFGRESSCEKIHFFQTAIDSSTNVIKLSQLHLYLKEQE